MLDALVGAREMLDVLVGVRETPAPTGSPKQRVVVQDGECFSAAAWSRCPDVWAQPGTKELLVFLPRCCWPGLQDLVTPFDDYVARGVEELEVVFEGRRMDKLFQRPMTRLKALRAHAGSHYGGDFNIPGEFLPALRELTIARYHTGTVPVPDELEVLRLIHCHESALFSVGGALVMPGEAIVITSGRKLRSLDVSSWDNIGGAAGSQKVSLEGFPCLESLRVREGALPSTMALVHAPLKKLEVHAFGPFALECGVVEELRLTFSQFNTEPAPERHIIRAAGVRHFYCDRPGISVSLADGTVVLAEPERNAIGRRSEQPEPLPCGESAR